VEQKKKMNGTIDCAFIGRLGEDPELKTSAAGNSRTGLLLDKVGCPVPPESRRPASTRPPLPELEEERAWLLAS
jgi:hypothetical protein